MNMAYSRGTNTNIIVGAAALFVHEDGPIASIPTWSATESAKETLAADDTFRNIGYTTNGVELDFVPDFGEVKVDQLLDVARLFKQGMKVNMKTTFAEATLENLLIALAGKTGDLTNTGKTLNLSAGDIGDVPVERGLIAVGPGSGDSALSATTERVYVAYRALSIEQVTVSAKRDAASEFQVSFRLLPDDNASYGKIIDRTWTPA